MTGRKILVPLGLVVFAAALAAQPAPPSTPSSPSPASGASGVALDVTLSWASDPNARKYDVHLGTTPSPPLVATVNNVASYQPALPLAPATTWAPVWVWRTDRSMSDSSPVAAIALPAAWAVKPAGAGMYCGLP